MGECHKGRESLTQKQSTARAKENLGACLRPLAQWDISPKIRLHQQSTLGGLGLNPPSKRSASLTFSQNSLNQCRHIRHDYGGLITCWPINQPLMLHQRGKTSGAGGELINLFLSGLGRKGQGSCLHGQGQRNHHKESFHFAHVCSMGPKNLPIN